MRPAQSLLVFAAISLLCACSRGLEFDIANNDSAALADAIRAANATPGHSTIRLARNGLYILTREAEAGLLLPVVSGRLTVEGNYAELRGYSAGPAAILEVGGDARLSIQDLVMAEGTNGTIRNYGQLRLTNVGVVDGSVSTLPAIVLNHGELEAIGGEIAYNHLLSNRRDAGTVLNYGEARFTDTRIHGNRAIGRYPTVAVAGGVLNFGVVEARGLSFSDNEIPSEEVQGLSFGGILNVGNGSVRGSSSSEDVRSAGVEEIIAIR